MSGAWEFPAPQVLVATLTREFTTAKWAANYRAMQLPGNSVTTMLSGMPYDHARNTACENMLANNFTWLFFLDDDVCIPIDTVPRLIAHGKDIVSGMYMRRAPPIAPVALNFDGQGRAQWISSWQPGALIEVDLVGAGCLLIHRRVLERMSRPWFDWELDRRDHPPHLGDRLSEDFAFCRKAKREFGFRIHVDTSIQCEHVGIGQAQMLAGPSFTPASV